MSQKKSEPLDLAVAFRFLRGLKRNNDRTWFHAHRGAWDEHVRHGFEDLVTMLLLAGSAVDDRLAHVDPRACLFRIANDTRFHKQKDPYKSWLSAWMSPGGKNGAYAGYYVHLAPGASHVSAGIWVPEKPALHALRSSFAADGADARAFDRILASRALQPYLPLETASMRVTPRGFPKTHPRIGSNPPSRFACDSTAAPSRCSPTRSARRPRSCVGWTPTRSPRTTKAVSTSR